MVEKSSGAVYLEEMQHDTAPHLFGLGAVYKKRFGQFISRRKATLEVQILILFTLESAIFFQFLTLNFQIFEIFPPRMLILTILSLKSAILDNFPLLKVKNMGKLSLLLNLS